MEEKIIYEPYKIDRYLCDIYIILAIIVDILLLPMINWKSVVSEIYYLFLICAGTFFLIFEAIRRYRHSFFTLIFDNEGVEVIDKYKKSKEYIPWSDIPYMYSRRRSDNRSAVVLTNKKCTAKDVKSIIRERKPVKNTIVFHDVLYSSAPGMIFLLEHYKGRYKHYSFWA